jgi:hypothetical protein
LWCAEVQPACTKIQKERILLCCQRLRSLKNLKGQQVFFREAGNLYDIIEIGDANESKLWVITDVGSDMFEAEFYLNMKPHHKKMFSFEAIRTVSSVK